MAGSSPAMTGMSSVTMRSSLLRGTLMFLRILDRLEEILIAIADGACDLHHLSSRCASLPDRHSLPVIRSCSRSTCRGRRSSASTCSCGWPSSAPPMACAPASMSASTSWSTSSSRRGETSSCCSVCSAGAFFTAVIGTMGAKFVYRARPHRSGVARSRDSELVRLSLHSARLLSDVLPLPAGRLDLFAPASCRTMITPMSRASRSKSRASARRRSRDDHASSSSAC